MVPFGVDMHLDSMGLFLYFLGEKLSAKERAEFVKGIGLTKREVDQWQKLEANSKKLEKDLKSAKLQKPSHVYQLLSKSPGDQILFLLAHSSERLVHDRIRNYLQKYLPSAQEVTERDVLATGVKPGTPKFQKAEEMILTKLDARPKKVPPPEPCRRNPCPVVPEGPRLVRLGNPQLRAAPAMARKSATLVSRLPYFEALPERIVFMIASFPS